MGTKVCTKCGQELPATSECFYKNKRRPDGLQQYCKQCQKQYYDQNVVQIKKMHKKHYKKNSQIILEKNKQYYEQNKDMMKIYNHQYRARKSELPCSYSLFQWFKTQEYFDGACAYCGHHVPLSQDHFVPVSKGGGYVASNIIPACKRCNSSKSQEDYFYWYPRQPFYTQRRANKIATYLQSQIVQPNVGGWGEEGQRAINDYWRKVVMA
jgi:5-methylcytosine-specific restriction endonuclease McrA